MYVRVMPSLGDAIYCRPFVRAFATRIETRWPDLFSDLLFSGSSGPEIRPRYDSKNLALGSILHAIGRFFPDPDPFVFDLPAFDKARHKYVVVRSPTLRPRFYSPARNPRIEYVHRAVELLTNPGIKIVGVGSAIDGERFDGEPPEVDEAHWRGDLTIRQLMGTIAGAQLVVAGPGWTVPAALAYGVPHVVIGGGAARWNTLDKLTDPRIDSSRLLMVEPDRFCRECRDVSHDCDKTITDFDRKFTTAVDKALSL